MYQNKIKSTKGSIKSVFDGYRLNEDTLLLLAGINVETQEGGSLSEKLLELIWILKNVCNCKFRNKNIFLNNKKT